MSESESGVHLVPDLPDATGAPDLPSIVGQECAACDNKTPFVDTTPAMMFKDGEGNERFAHEACFHRARCAGLEQLLNGTKQELEKQRGLLASVVAAWGGTVNVGMTAIQRAAASGFHVLEEKRSAAGGLRLRLGDKLPAPPAAPASEQAGL